MGFCARSKSASSINGQIVQVPSCLSPRGIIVDTMLKWAWVVFPAQDAKQYRVRSLRIVDTPDNLTASIVCNASEEQGVAVRLDVQVELVFKLVEQILLLLGRKTIEYQLDTIDQHGEMPGKG